MNSAQTQPELEAQSARRKVICFGLDVAKNHFLSGMASSDAAPFQAPGLRKIKTRSFPNTKQHAQAFLQWAGPQVSDGFEMLVAMEATGPYSAQLAAWLLELRPGLRLVIVDPRRPKAFAQSLGVRNKTDTVDARVISAYGADRQPLSDEPVEQIYRDLRGLTRTRMFLLHEQTAMKNHLEMLVTDTLSRSVGRELTAALKSVLKQLENKIAELEERMMQMVKDAPEQLGQDVAQMDQICGVGALTAITVLAEMGDLRRFRTSRQLVAMAGLNPEVKTSGKWVGESHLSKRGSSYIRRALYMCSLSAIGCDCSFRDFYERLVNKSHKTKMVALAAVMRKLLTTMRAVVVTQKPYQRHYNPCEKLAAIS